MRFRLICMAALTALLTSACGPVPKPFQAPEFAKVHNPHLLPPDASGVVVGRIQGPVAWVGGELAGAVAAALRDRGVLAGAVASNRHSLLLSAEGYRQTGTGPAELVIAWVLSRPDGIVMRTRETRFVPPPAFWDTPTPTLFRGVAREIAVRVVDWIVVDGEPLRIAITTVEGAPGNGDAVFRRAVTAALREHRIDTAPIETATLMVLPNITVTSVDPDRERIQMRWTVIAPDGTEIGRVDQENTLAAGRLDGDWGSVAQAIVDAVVPDIVRLVRIYRAVLAGRRQPPPQ